PRDRPPAPAGTVRPPGGDRPPTRRGPSARPAVRYRDSGSVIIVRASCRPEGSGAWPKSGGGMAQKSMQAEPYEFAFDLETTALIVIDMQRDFVEAGGFGEALGNDVAPLQAVIAPCKRVLDAARRIGMMVIHTREG